MRGKIYEKSEKKVLARIAKELGIKNSSWSSIKGRIVELKSYEEKNYKEHIEGK